MPSRFRGCHFACELTWLTVLPPSRQRCCGPIPAGFGDHRLWHKSIAVAGRSGRPRARASCLLSIDNESLQQPTARRARTLARAKRQRRACVQIVGALHDNE